MEEVRSSILLSSTNVDLADDTIAVLQTAGVPSRPVQRSADIVADLVDRRHVRSVAHPTLGDLVIEGLCVAFSRTAGDASTLGPTSGGDSDHVLKRLLGDDEERFVDLVVSGAVE